MPKQQSLVTNNTTGYGNWNSSISSNLSAKNSISIDEPKQTKDSIFYIERRPTENGRCVIVQYTNNIKLDILPKPYSARSRVHEYGGGSYYADDERVFFINDSDQDIYAISELKTSRITNNKNYRYADLCFDSINHRIIAICEYHNDGKVTNTIVSINLANNDVDTLAEGNDFYASPRLNSSATKLCWQTWNHPNMPWDGNQLWQANIDSKHCLSNQEHIAGSNDIAVFQPQWSPDDVLFYIADDTEWWQIYRYNHKGSSYKAEQLTFDEKEFGLPQWVFAQSSYAFINNNQLICYYQQKSINTLAILSFNNKPTLTTLFTTWQEFSSISSYGNKISFIAATSIDFPTLISASINIASGELNTTAIQTTCQSELPKEHYSQAKVISFHNRHKQLVYANYYAPTNPRHQLHDTKKPPLIVISHGGPTGQSCMALDPKKQFWTSRGFALLDVNYSGSTGYGKEYRSRLNGKWGVLDVEDCCDAALYAVNNGLADSKQLIIRGSSAGGYTVLSALTFEQVFHAGASYYGISELTSLASDTHKFESRYLDKLIGPYPDKKSIYELRSPINSVEQLNCPVIFFQGTEDKVVPKEQAEKMFNLLNTKGLTVAAQYFEGEQHGFRKAESITHSLENELNFYQLVFKLKPTDEIVFSGEISVLNT